MTGHEISRIKYYFIGPNPVKSPIKMTTPGRKIGAMLWILLLVKILSPFSFDEDYEKTDFIVVIG